jgi:signal transduction histidine kinase
VPLSVRAREALAIAIVVLLVVAVTTIAHLVSVAQIMLQAAAEEGRLLARQLFHQSARVIPLGQTPSLDDLQRDSSIRALLEGMVGYSRVVVYAAIVDPARRAVVHSDPALQGKILDRTETLDDVLNWGAPRMLIALFGGPQVYEARLPIRVGERPFGTVRVGISTVLVRQELRQALVRGVAFGAGALGIAVAVGLGAGRVLLRLCRQIAQRVDRLARGGLEPGVEITRGDEMGMLAEQVNRLGEQIHAKRHAGEGGGERTEGAIEGLEDAVLFLNVQREVIFCNHAAERVLGQTIEALTGRPLEATLPADHPLLPIVVELFETEQGRHTRPVTLPGRDAPGREVAVSSYRVQEGDQPGGGVLVLRDLEPARAVETLVTYAQKLAALGRLTSGVTHEVKNPLNAMRIHLEVLRARLPEPTQEVTDNLEVIAQEIQRLDRVVQGFLKFMRPQDLHLGPVDVNALLADVARLAGPEATLAGVNIVCDLAADLSPITGDVELLHQAVTNLVTNAIQAMPKGGTVTLTTRLSPDGTVALRVADQGVGIPPEDLDQIFRLYYTTKEGGSGIGLSLVYRIIQMHEGRIDVESTLGEGTTLSVSLPRGPMGGQA